MVRVSGRPRSLRGWELPPRLPPVMLRDNWRYRATLPTMARCHLRECPQLCAVRFAGYQATAGTPPERAVRDALPGTRSPAHIDDFLTDWPTRTSRATPPAPNAVT
jgi:hypothetical protein